MPKSSKIGNEKHLFLDVGMPLLEYRRHCETHLWIVNSWIDVDNMSHRERVLFDANIIKRRGNETRVPFCAPFLEGLSLCCSYGDFGAAMVLCGDYQKIMEKVVSMRT